MKAQQCVFFVSAKNYKIFKKMYHKVLTLSYNKTRILLAVKD